MADYSNLSDQILADLLKSSDRRAFTEIYNRYRGVLYLVAFKLTQNTEEAEDIVQDIFINLWDRAETVRLTTDLKSYLYAAVRYKFFNLLDHKKVITRHELSFNQFISKAEFVTDNQVRENELARLMEIEIQRLPEKMKIVFQFSRTDHLSPKKIAELLNISEHTVKKQLSNAIKILKVKLGNLISIFF